jgi:uncharacterized membrane protein YdbT with pleckstrin-like domain
MKYVEKVLQPGETVIYATSLHWLIYLKAILLLIVAVLCLIASGWFSGPNGDTWIKIALLAAAGLFALLGFVSAMSAFIQRVTTELAVTDRRVIFKTGIIRRHTVEINRSKVETVGVNQSILGRILGYGTVIVRGTGGSFEPIPYIGEPLTFRSHITAS